MSESDQREHFFSSKHLIPAGWTAIFTIIGIVLGILIHQFRGPEKVVVSNFPVAKAPGRVTLVSELSPGSIDALNHLSGELDGLSRRLAAMERRPAQGPDQATGKADALNNDIAHVKDEIDRLRGLVQRAKAPQNEQESRSNIQSPPFDLPKIVKGYYLLAMTGVTDVYCPQRDMGRDVALQFGFKVAHDELLQGTTPLFVSVNKVISPENLYQIYAQQFAIQHDNNDYQVRLKLDPGNYEMDFGYYFRNAVNTQYPKFYGRTCKITVHG